jgi:hypothetical protein
MNSREIFLKLLDEWKPSEELNTVGEMESYILHRAHEMCRSGEISFDIFGRIMDEAVCY